MPFISPKRHLDKFKKFPSILEEVDVDLKDMQLKKLKNNRRFVVIHQNQDSNLDKNAYSEAESK